MNKKGYVYLICDPDKELYKIGVTKNICSRRMKQLQTGNPSELHIVNYHETHYPYRIETMLHNFLHNKQIYNEWYQMDINDINNFTNMCMKAENIIQSLIDNPFFMKNIR